MSSAALKKAVVVVIVVLVVATAAENRCMGLEISVVEGFEGIFAMSTGNWARPWMLSRWPGGGEFPSDGRFRGRRCCPWRTGCAGRTKEKKKILFGENL